MHDADDNTIVVLVGYSGEEKLLREKSILNILWLHAKTPKTLGAIKNRIYCGEAYSLTLNITCKRKALYKVKFKSVCCQ